MSNLAEQGRSTNSRRYEMVRRAEHVAETRRRIVEAAVHLHGTVGPAETTVTALAEQAGVTRLTVYRHFPDRDALFAACSAHWLSGMVLPDPSAWSVVRDPAGRLRVGLTDLYRFYRSGEAMLTRIEADESSLPEPARAARSAIVSRCREGLLSAFPVRSRTRRRRAAVGHAVAYTTWRSLVVDEGLADRDAVELMASLVLGAG
jgi:AcrR family transcriptional regulator